MPVCSTCRRNRRIRWSTRQAASSRRRRHHRSKLPQATWGQGRTSGPSTRLHRENRWCPYRCDQRRPHHRPRHLSRPAHRLRQRRCHQRPARPYPSEGLRLSPARPFRRSRLPCRLEHRTPPTGHRQRRLRRRGACQLGHPRARHQKESWLVAFRPSLPPERSRSRTGPLRRCRSLEDSTCPSNLLRQWRSRGGLPFRPVRLRPHLTWHRAQTRRYRQRLHCRHERCCHHGRPLRHDHPTWRRRLGRLRGRNGPSGRPVASPRQRRSSRTDR
jgi:hypothetical protein